MTTSPPQICWAQENGRKTIKHYIEDCLTIGEEMTVTSL